MTSIALIQRATAAHYGLTLADLTSPGRQGRVVGPRHLAMAIAVSTGKSLTTVARAFGRQDHTTVLHAVRVVAEREAHDPGLRYSRAMIERAVGIVPATSYAAEAANVEPLP